MIPALSFRWKMDAEDIRSMICAKALSAIVIILYIVLCVALHCEYSNTVSIGTTILLSIIFAMIGVVKALVGVIRLGIGVFFIVCIITACVTDDTMFSILYTLLLAAADFAGMLIAAIEIDSDVIG